MGRFTSFSPEIEFFPSRFIHHLKTVFYTLRKSFQTTSASPCLIYAIAFVSLICSFKVML
ncbi:hypothetical protein FJR77_05555 [Streptococcus shenyangsis]|uniref:Uncharacterized protein n=1 Tax=Streptococcus shenyangsis TaxID=2589786 RepID=A0ABY2YHW2_9STRE|nr:hypothetical protein FJR77_05555 [Streptococcus shenyangsis]TPE40110.1 hypothetical protein FJR73_05015 [Streptococcus sp. D2]